jgi:iron complex outermembrane recepter protein
VSLDQEFPISSTVKGFVGGSVAYVGDRLGAFQTSATAPRARFPSYVDTDLRAGVRYASWELNMFVNNLTDKRAILNGDPAISPNFTFTRPRSMGLLVSKNFD